MLWLSPQSSGGSQGKAARQALRVSVPSPGCPSWPVCLRSVSWPPPPLLPSLWRVRRGADCCRPGSPSRPGLANGTRTRGRTESEGNSWCPRPLSPLHPPARTGQLWFQVPPWWPWTLHSAHAHATQGRRCFPQAGATISPRPGALLCLFQAPSPFPVLIPLGETLKVASVPLGTAMAPGPPLPSYMTDGKLFPLPGWPHFQGPFCAHSRIFL